MKISLCMILKNEGKTIRRAIESVLPVIDEIVIGIDKSTTDNTKKEIGKINISDVEFSLDNYEFKDDFASARNKFIEKCSGDYVLILDGHEYMTEKSLSYLQEFKDRNLMNLDVIDFNIHMDETAVFQQSRLFKPFVKYEFAIHNTITHLDNRVAMPQISIIHDQPFERYQARKKQRSEMNIEGLEKKNDPRSLFYLATQYYELGQYLKAMAAFEDYLEVTDFESEAYQARLYLSTCYKELGNSKKRMSVLMDCFDDNVPRNEHLIAIGNIHFENKKFNQAKYYYRLATAVKLPQRFLIIDINHYRHIPWYKLMLTCMELDDVEGTMEAIRKGKTFVPIIPDFFIAEENVKKKVFSKIKQKKGSIYVVDSLQTFIKPLLNKLSEDYYIRIDQTFNQDNADQADLIWCDWADENAIALSNYKGKAKKILRVHSYEVYSDYIKNIDFQVFDKVIFVAQHVQDYLENERGAELINTTVIPNGVNLDKFEISHEKERMTKRKRNKVAFAGRLCQTKGIQLILDAAKRNPMFEYHIAGTFQEKDLEYYCKNNSSKNVFWYSWQKDLNKFYADKTYIISASIREGCPVALLEGMACGLKPIFESTWVGYDSFSSGSDDYFANREIVEKNFNEIDQLNKFDKTIKEILA